MVRFDDLSDKIFEVNINLAPEERGRGAGYKFLKTACNYAFKQFDIQEIYAEIKKINFASIKIFEKIGFVHTGQKDEEIIMMELHKQ